jgi:hypothetical protein
MGDGEATNIQDKTYLTDGLSYVCQVLSHDRGRPLTSAGSIDARRRTFLARFINNATTSIDQL